MGLKYHVFGVEEEQWEMWERWREGRGKGERLSQK